MEEIEIALNALRSNSFSKLLHPANDEFPFSHQQIWRRNEAELPDFFYLGLCRCETVESAAVKIPSAHSLTSAEKVHAAWAGLLFEI